MWSANVSLVSQAELLGVLLPNNHSSSSESHPPTMHEDRAILDTVFATNRSAIIDLHNLTSSPETVCKTAANDHGHGDVSASSAGASPLPDLPPVAPEAVSAMSRTAPSRSFSRRGMRLGVHMSILDMGAHSAPDALKNKWIQTSRLHHPIKPMMSGARSPHKSHVRLPLEDSPSNAHVSPGKQPLSDSNHSRKASHGWTFSPKAGKLHKMIDQLEQSHSSAILKLVPRSRRRSSVSKHPTQATHAEGTRRRQSLSE